MHLIETYATNCGVRIEKPFVYEKYMPTPDGKYILFQPHSKPAKTYDYWQDVIDLLSPKLKDLNINIVQIGAAGEKVYGGVINFVGHTKINQCAYLLRNAAAFIGCDSFCVHLASSFDKPIVALYSNNNINNVGPYWGDRKNQILIEPKRKNGQRPNYNLEENPKSINTISPESIASGLLKLLGSPHSFPFETVLSGDLYHGRLLELVPDQAVELGQFGVGSIIVRMDYLHNEEILISQLNLGHVSIVTNKEINIDILKNFKSRVNEIVYIIEKNTHNPKFIENVVKLGIRVILLTYENQEVVNSLKIDYMDFGIITVKKVEEPEELKEIPKSKRFYKNGKFVLGRGRIYPSKEAWRLDIPINSFTPQVNLIRDDFSVDFWKEKDHHSFLVCNL